MSNVVGASLLEVSEIDFDQTEFEEDLLATIIAATIAGLIFSKSGSMNLDFQTANLLPVSPPPKHTQFNGRPLQVADSNLWLL